MPSGSKKTSNAVLKQLRLTARTLDYADLETYVIELNIHEDMFGNSVYGTLIMTDSRNLIRELPIEGEEFLYIHLKTQGYADDPIIEIQKEFRVFRISDRTVDHQKGIQVYTLHFCSKEVFRDTLTPLYRVFGEKPIYELVEEIFTEYLQLERYPGGELNELEILDETKNAAKFISPGWSPIKCINWLASKAISVDGDACNYLFWETTKGYYFGSVEKIFINLALGNNTAGRYRLLDRDLDLNTIPGAEAEANREFFAVNRLNIDNVSDMLKVVSEGEIANNVLSVDLNKKDFKNTIYNHSEMFHNYTHLMSEESSYAIWGESINANPKNSIYYVSKNTHLFDDCDNNVNEIYKDVFGKRIANLRDINQFKIVISIMGRTDIQAGTIIYLEFPETRPKTEQDINQPETDIRYTGYYLITALRHKYTNFNYITVLECVKDTFNRKLTNGVDSEFFFTYDAEGNILT